MPVFAYIQDGDTVIVPRRKLVRISCCDCALVHDFHFDVDRKGEITVSISRNDHETDKLRKELRNA